jgi:hypothetical protein
MVQGHRHPDQRSVRLINIFVDLVTYAIDPRVEL